MSAALQRSDQTDSEGAPPAFVLPALLIQELNIHSVPNSTSQRDHMTLVLVALHWLPIKSRIDL